MVNPYHHMDPFTCIFDMTGFEVAYDAIRTNPVA